MVTIVDADPGWPDDFERVADGVRAALGPEAPRIEHIASTHVHVHVRGDGRANARYALLFRDFLRTHEKEATAYAELKRRLATIPPDCDTYADTKDPACDLIYFAAERWARETGWTVKKPGPGIQGFD